MTSENTRKPISPRSRVFLRLYIAGLIAVVMLSLAWNFILDASPWFDVTDDNGATKVSLKEESVAALLQYADGALGDTAKNGGPRVGPGRAPVDIRASSHLQAGSFASAVRRVTHRRVG